MKNVLSHRGFLILTGWLITTLVICLGLSALWPVLLVVPNVMYRVDIKLHQTSFDSAIWKSVHWTTEARGENRVRDYMLDDLLKNHNFNGWQRRDIVDLLGEADDERPNFADDGLTYSWYRIDGPFDYLLFMYDKNDIVVDYLVSHD